MDSRIILIVGFPGVGKDSLCDYLVKNSGDKKFVKFKKHRGTDKDFNNLSYYNISIDDFNLKMKNGDFLQYHTRYNRFYGIDKAELEENLNKYNVVLLQAGRFEDVNAIFNSIDFPVSIVFLWEKFDIVNQRIIKREKTKMKIKQRVKEYNIELQDWKKHFNKLVNFDFFIKSETVESSAKKMLNFLENKEYSDERDEFFEYIMEDSNGIIS